MPQDVVDLGLDIAGFDQKKKEVLNDFIRVFDKLSEYDGKKISLSVSIRSFKNLNKSIEDSTKMLGDLNAALEKLNKTSASIRPVNMSPNEYASFAKEADTMRKKIEDLTKKVSDQQKEITALNAGLSSTAKNIIASGTAANSAASSSSKLTSETKSQSRAVKDLETDYGKLKARLKDQAAEYARLHMTLGENAPETKAALREYGNTAAVIDDISKGLKSAEPAVFGLGKGLSTIYNHLRIIAYVVPGIGIAGIMNLASDAVMGLVDATGLFIDKQLKSLESGKRVNDSMIQQIGIVKELTAAQKEYWKNYGSGGGSSGLDPSSKSVHEREIEAAEKRAQGIDRVTQSTYDLKTAQDKLSQSKFDIGEKPGYMETADQILEQKKKEAFDALVIMQKSADKIRQINTQLEKERTKSKWFTGGDIYDFGSESRIKKLELQKDIEESSFNIFKDEYRKKSEILENFYEAQRQFVEADLEHKKLLADEERKLQLSLAKDILDTVTTSNNIILNSDKSTEEQRIKAIKNISDASNRYSRAQMMDVTMNISSTPKEIEAAMHKYNTSVLNLNKETEEKINKLREDYRQKRLDFQLKIDSEELNQLVVQNRKISLNESSSLTERLKAYSAYVAARQKLQDKQFERNIDRLRLSNTNDPTVKKEIESEASNAISQKLVAQADAQREVFDIIYSSLSNQLKRIRQLNEEETLENERLYAKALNDLNESYEKRLISTRKYREERRRIDKQFTISGIDEDIEDDLKDLERVRNHLMDATVELNKSKKELEAASAKFLTAAMTGLPMIEFQKEVDIATGKVKGAQKAVDDAEAERKKRERKLERDRLRRAQVDRSRGDDSTDWIDLAILAEERLFSTIKEISNMEYQFRLQALEEKKRLIDEQYDYEIDAIRRSTLSEKDKVAQEIQLQAQKREADKKAQAEEKRLKIQQARFDKKITIANIMLATALNVARAAGNPFRVAAALVVGASQLAVARAVEIPSFAEGVEGFKGGYARYGEAGPEVVKEPGKKPFLATKETISYLAKGTDIIPVKDLPDFAKPTVTKRDDGWEQTIWLGKQIRKGLRPKINNVNVINVDTKFEHYKVNILGR